MSLWQQAARWMLLGVLCQGSYSARPAVWSVARSSHFEVYSQAGNESAQSALDRFERLRAFFEQNELIRSDHHLEERPRVQVIGFGSTKEYNAFRLRATADAYYIGSESQDYIVMPGLGSRELGIGAHEYTHLVLHSDRLKLPRWLNEGLAEFFATVRLSEKECEVGGMISVHRQTLMHRVWLPTAELLAMQDGSPLLQSREGTALFYAQNWALVNLLISSPDYAPRFHQLVQRLNAGAESEQSLTGTYGKSLDSLMQEVRAAVDQDNFKAVRLPAIPKPAFRSESATLSEIQGNELLAGLMSAEGELDKSEALYRHLAQQSPEKPDNYAALGTIALARGNTTEARVEWKQALDRGMSDANLCYRYAVLADESGLPEGEVRRTLEQAVRLKPDFDDARYKLALLDNNSREFAAALMQLRAMRSVAPDRAYAYWTASAYALTELDQREEAVGSAREAMKYAKTAAERANAAQLEYVAKTDLTVQFAKDEAGNMRLVTARSPHGATDWNPFVEQGDQIRRVKGTLREVQCGEGKLTGIVVQTPEGLVSLSVPDPQHVAVRNGPPELTCGPQVATAVALEYAAQKSSGASSGILRGLSFSR